MQKLSLFISFRFHQAESQKQQSIEYITLRNFNFLFGGIRFDFSVNAWEFRAPIGFISPAAVLVAGVLFVFPLCVEKLSKQMINQRRLKACGMWNVLTQPGTLVSAVLLPFELKLKSKADTELEVQMNGNWQADLAVVPWRYTQKKAASYIYSVDRCSMLDEY